MNFKKLGLTPGVIKNISRVLLLSFTWSVLFEATTLRAQSATLSTAAQAQRTKMATSLSTALTSYLANKSATGSQIPAWNQGTAATASTPANPGLLARLQANQKVDPTIGLLPSDVLTKSAFLGKYSYAGLYNYVASVPGSNLYSLHPNIPAYLMYFGDGSGSGSVPAYGESGSIDYLTTGPGQYPQTSFPLASFFVPNSQPSIANYSFPTTGNFEPLGEILIKTGPFCKALDQAYGTSQAGSGWIGATCVANSDCCQNLTGQTKGVGTAGSITCQTSFSQAPAMLDPQGTGKQIPYGICDVMPTCSGGNAVGTCGVAPAGVKPSTCCNNGLTMVPGLLGCKCLIPIGNTGVTPGITCKGNSDCVPATAGNAVTCVAGVCTQQAYAGFNQSCSLTAPVSVTTTCVSGADLVCDVKDATVEDQTYTATNECKGTTGYACSGDSDCQAGYECIDDTIDVCGMICTQNTIANNKSCSTDGGSPCCANPGFVCGLSSAAKGSPGSGTNVCCINPKAGSASANQPAFSAADCCSGSIYTPTGMNITVCSGNNYASCSDATVATDCPPINGAAQTCISVPKYLCIDPKSKNGLSNLAMDLIAGLGGTVAIIAGVAFWFYKRKSRIAAALETAKGMTRAAAADELQARVQSATDTDLAGIAGETGINLDALKAMRAGALAIAAAPEPADGNGVAVRTDAATGVPGAPEDIAALPAAQQPPNLGDILPEVAPAGGNPLVSLGDAAMLAEAMAQIPQPPAGSDGWSLMNTVLGKNGAGDLLRFDNGHEVAKAYVIRRIMNPGEKAGVSLKEILGNNISADYQTALAKQGAGGVTYAQAARIAITVLKSRVVAGSGEGVNATALRMLAANDPGRFEILQAMTSQTEITDDNIAVFQDAYASLVDPTLLDANGNQIFQALDANDLPAMPQMPEGTFFGP